MFLRGLGMDAGYYKAIRCRKGTPDREQNGAQIRLTDMKKILLCIALAALGLSAACSQGGPAASPTPAVETERPTPRPTQEWVLQEITVEGDTVTVSLSVFVGIAVRVRLDGQEATRVDQELPTLDYVFEKVAPGEHSIEIRDVVGFREMASVTVAEPSPDAGGTPDWLTEWLDDLESGREENPPQSITQYEYGGETVYYVVKACCDQFSDLLNAEDILIGHPDGGITGQGDGRTSFLPYAREGIEIWPIP